MAGTVSQEAFAAAWFAPACTPDQGGLAWKLLSMQAWGLASFASCAWFFDEISRLEPVNGLTFALRAMELARATGMADPEPEVTGILAEARSNDPAMGTGRDIWDTMVRPRRETPKTLITQGLLTLSLEDRLPAGGDAAVAAWPGVAVTVRLDDQTGDARTGTASIRYHLETATEDFAITFRPAPAADPFDGCVTLEPAAGGPEEGVCFQNVGLPVNKRQSLADAFARHAEAVFFKAMLAQAATARRLVTELQEAQDTINLAPQWLHLWPGLVWHEVFELPLPEKRAALLRLFLLEAGRNSPVKAALEARLGAEMVRCITRPDPDAGLLARLVHHTADLDVRPDWWAAQNALWERRPFAGAMVDLARALGFCGVGGRVESGEWRDDGGRVEGTEKAKRKRPPAAGGDNPPRTPLTGETGETGEVGEAGETEGGGVVDLTGLNAYRVRAVAAWCAFPGTVGELAAALRESVGGRLQLLGHGCNVILSRDWYGPEHRFVCTRALDAAVVVDGSGLWAGAGARLRDVCRAAARAGLSGLERLWDIPGSVGGAAVMNAGAYGASFYDVVEAVEVLHPGEGAVRAVPRERCRPAYRATAFQGTAAVIVGVRLRLGTGDPAGILAEMGRIGRLRRSRLPYDRPSAGSVFRRPEGAPPVGVIMEEAGLKGFAIGGARISRRHAGFIVNAGGATGADILAVVEVMKDAARARYGVELALEQVVV